MEVYFIGSGDGFEFRVKVDWHAFVAFAKALVATIGVVLALLGAEQVGTHVQILLGR